jgi:hypothetical protein
VCPDRSKLNPPTDPIRIRLDFGERIDPAAADALWRIVLGGVEADTGGGPSAEGAGTRRAGRHSEHTGGIVEAGPDVSA